jgi:2,5-diamino-6-(ribosylamino)-4(3H)-pyrimidinone 5'-phosphate reductase
MPHYVALLRGISPLNPNIRNENLRRVFDGLHYQIAAEFGESVRLVGSNTAAVSIELFGNFTSENEGDLRKPVKTEGSYWVIPDSKAVLQGKLHYFRRSEYCRDVIVLVSESTPSDYLTYLRERGYEFFVSGGEKVDLSQASRR